VSQSPVAPLKDMHWVIWKTPWVSTMFTLVSAGEVSSAFGSLIVLLLTDVLHVPEAATAAIGRIALLHARPSFGVDSPSMTQSATPSYRQWSQTYLVSIKVMFSA
jgi:hypothetical protein